MKKSLICQLIIIFAILVITSIFAACSSNLHNEEDSELQVSYVASKGGYIEGEITQSIRYGEKTNEVIAVPNEGYKFIKWSDGQKSPKRQDTVIDELYVTAVFEFIFEGGEGSELNPFLIKSYEQFLNMIYYPNDNYKLVQDLSLEDNNHKPIFNEGNCFNGCFDGNGNTIRNLNIKGYENFSSLFGFIGSEGVVKNLNLTNVTINISNYKSSIEPLCVGTVAGVSLGLLSNIYVEGNILCDTLCCSGTIGGLVGQSQNIIENCCTDVHINLTDVEMSTDKFYIGGLVGITEGDLFQCESNGKIDLLQGHLSTIEDDSEIIIGGLIGIIFIFGLDVPNVIINECASSVNIKSEYHCAIGGLLGASIVKGNQNFYTTIINCSASGDIVCESGNIAGFIYDCSNNDNALFYNCNAIGNVTNYQGSASGFIGKGRGVISYCSATGNINAALHASGFCDFFTGKIFRSFATGVVESQYIASGFGYMCDGVVEECLSTGTVTSTSVKYPNGRASGFFILVTEKLINCYSTSDVLVKNLRSDVSILAVGLTDAGSLYNCYYSGKITINQTTSPNSILGALTSGRGDRDIKNCHWLYYDDSLVNFPFNFDRNPNLVTELYRYDNKLEMCTKVIVDSLNNGGTNNTWIWIEGHLPQLRFFWQLHNK